MKLILLYTLVAGAISAVTALEVFMIVHLAKVNDHKLGFKEIGYTVVAIWGFSTLLQDTALELLNFFPVIGWAAEMIVAVLFVFFLGNLASLYFRKKP